MEKGTYKSISRNVGICHLKEEHLSSDKYMVYEDRYDFKYNFSKPYRLGFIISCGGTIEEALMKAVEVLVEEKRMAALKIKKILSGIDNESGEMIILNDLGEPEYDIDKRFLPTYPFNLDEND
jgi:hypothetical protein